MTLSNANSGDNIEIKSISNPIVRAQAIRLGIYEGAILKCSEKIKHGPIILQNRSQELAIGYNLSKNIEIAVI